MGTNGKVVSGKPLPKPAGPPQYTASKIAIGFLPFTPVPFSGIDLLISTGRLAAYSLLAYLTYNKMRPASYVFIGAAGLSLATSLSAGWGKAIADKPGVTDG